MRKRVLRSRLLPGTVVISTGAWYLVILLSGSSATDAMDAGLLVGPFGSGNAELINPMAGLDVARIDWSPIFSNSGSIASIFLIAIMSMMLCISGLGYLTGYNTGTSVQLQALRLRHVCQATTNRPLEE